MHAMYRAADVFCLPTELEPCGLVFLEAMSAGLPVVAAYSGGVPELVRHNHNGLLSSPRDVSALAENLLRVLTDQELARRLGAAGHGRAHTEFSPQTVCERWLAALDSFR
jgi:glycosyltransferase involved in cell wall biosynthesis